MQVSEIFVPEEPFIVQEGQSFAPLTLWRGLDKA
jgi:hypothetical protein